MNTVALVLFVLMPAAGIGVAIWRWRWLRRATRVTGTVVGLRPSDPSARQWVVDFHAEGQRIRVNLPTSPRTSDLGIGDNLPLLYPEAKPGLARHDTGLMLWWLPIALVAPGLGIALFIGLSMLSARIQRISFDASRVHYAAQTASWDWYPAFGMAPLVVFASVLIFFGIRRLRRDLMQSLAMILPAGALFGLVAHINLNQTWPETPSCLNPEVAKVRSFGGTIERVTSRTRRTRQQFEIVINGETFQSAGLNSMSECGYKASVAQSMPLTEGAKVQLKLAGSKIIELRLLP